jgi:hypothetical protein
MGIDAPPPPPEPPPDAPVDESGAQPEDREVSATEDEQTIGTAVDQPEPVLPPDDPVEHGLADQDGPAADEMGYESDVAPVEEPEPVLSPEETVDEPPHDVDGADLQSDVETLPADETSTESDTAPVEELELVLPPGETADEPTLDTDAGAGTPQSEVGVPFREDASSASEGGLEEESEPVLQPEETDDPPSPAGDVDDPPPGVDASPADDTTPGSESRWEEEPGPVLPPEETGDQLPSDGRGDELMLADANDVEDTSTLSETEARDFLLEHGFSEDDASHFAHSFDGPITAREIHGGESFFRYTDHPDGTGSFVSKWEFESPDDKDVINVDPDSNHAVWRQVVTARESTTVLEGPVRGGAVDQTLIIDKDNFDYGPGEAFYPLPAVWEAGHDAT